MIFSILLLFLSLFRLLHYKHNLLFFSDCIRKICPADCSLPVIFDCRFSFCKVRNPLCFQFFQSGNLTFHIAVESASGAVQTGDHTTHSQIDQFISKWFRICHPQVFSGTRKLCGASGSLLSCFTETLKWFDYSSWFLHCGEFKYILSVKLINIKNILTGMKLKCLLSVRILTFYLHSFIFHICTFPETMAFIFQLSTNSPDFQIFKLKSNTSTFIRKFFPFP